MLTGVIVKGHVILGVAQHDLGQGRKLRGLDPIPSGGIVDLECLSHTAVVVETQKKVTVAGKVRTPVTSDRPRARDIRRREMRFPGEAEVEAEAVIEGTIPGSEHRVDGKGPVPREGKGPGDFIKGHGEPGHRGPRRVQNRIDGIGHFAGAVVAIGDLNRKGQTGTVDDLETDIPPLLREDKVVIGKLDGRNTNPENIANGGGECQKIVRRRTGSRRIPKATIDVDNVFGNVVRSQLQRNIQYSRSGHRFHRLSLRDPGLFRGRLDRARVSTASR